jgi:hypothetical protein
MVKGYGECRGWRVLMPLARVLTRGIERRRILDDRRGREDFICRMGERGSSTIAFLADFAIPLAEAARQLGFCT